MLIFTNSAGESITFSRNSPYRILTFDGRGGVNAEVQTQKAPFQDGKTWIDSPLEMREIFLEGRIVDDDLTGRRRDLSRVFNPKLGEGILRYTGNGEHPDMEIICVVEVSPIFAEPGLVVQDFQVTLLAPNPFWRDTNPTNVKLEDYVGNFSFPFSFPVAFAIRGDTRVLENNGHVPTPIKVTFNGEAVNPKITKLNTGEFIKVNQTIPQGYSLVITTYFNDKSVVIISSDGQETNAMGYIDLESTFFSLDVGENRLSFITEGGQPEVYIEYRNLFVGV